MDGDKTGENLEQTGLAGPVRTAQVHHLAFAYFQGSSCEEGEPAGERYGLVETNSKRHEDRPCYGGLDVQVTRVTKRRPDRRGGSGGKRARRPRALSPGSGNLAAQQVEVGVDH